MKTLSVSTGKGGVGKTFTALSLAKEFASFRKQRVLLIDADPSCNLTSRALPPGARPPLDILHLFKDPKCDVTDIIMPADVSQFPGIDIIPGSPALDNIDSLLFNRRGREKILAMALAQKGVAAKYDLVIIDCSPSRGTLVANAICAADGIISPMSLDDNSIDGVFAIEALVAELFSLDIMKKEPKLLGAFITAFDKPKSHGTRRVLANAVEHLTRLIDIKIPASSHVREAISDGATLQTKREHPVAIAYSNLANYITENL